jgi:hypothetical protein
MTTQLFAGHDTTHLRAGCEHCSPELLAGREGVGYLHPLLGSWSSRLPMGVLVLFCGGGRVLEGDGDPGVVTLQEDVYSGAI